MAVLRALKQDLRRRDLSLNLEWVTMNSEAAARATFITAAILGIDNCRCLFHRGWQNGVTRER